MAQKELEQEGITKEVLSETDISKAKFDAQLKKGDEPVTLFKCSQGFWVMVDFGEFLMDENGKRIIISEKDAKVGRARYLINFREQIDEQVNKVRDRKIQEEKERLIERAKAEAEKHLRTLRNYLMYAGELEDSENHEISNLLLEVEKQEAPEEYEAKREFIQANKDRFKEAYDYLNELLESEDYDRLYIALFQDGMPLLASYSGGNVQDLESSPIHADKIEKTIEETKDKSHLWKLAMFNVEKREK